LDLVEVPAAPMARRHPWETARFAFFRDVLRGAGLLAPDRPVLDVGAGDAWFAAALAREPERPPVVAWDAAYAKGLPAERPEVRFVAERPGEAFGAVLLLDVIEHVDDDRGFVATIARENVVAGGHVLVSVPAWPRLFGSHDERLGHARRYTPRAARAVVEGAGLEVVLAGGLFHALLPVRMLQLLAERWSREAPPLAGGWDGSSATTAVLDAALSAEGRASRWLARRGVELPGLSWWALCRRR
jgi:SAM-dependent methyltransferase